MENPVLHRDLNANKNANERAFDPTWTIYIGDIPSSVTNDFLDELLTESAKPLSVVLEQKGNGYKYAFAKFASKEHAQKVIDELNFVKLDGTPIRICHADTDTRSIIQSNENTLVVKNLNENIEVSQLHNAFSHFGEIVSCKVPQKDGKSFGYGYVTYRAKDDCERALLDLAQATFDGIPIGLERYQIQDKSQLNFTNVFIKNIPPSIQDEDSFREFFSAYGKVDTVLLKTNQKGIRLGFCNFSDHSEAMSAIEKLNGTVYDGVEMSVSRAISLKEQLSNSNDGNLQRKQKLYENRKNRNLYIKGFDYEMTDDEFRNLFTQFGEIESCVIKKESFPPFTSKEFGFVCFKNQESAQKCLKFSVLPGLSYKKKPLYVSLFLAQDDRIKIQEIKMSIKKRFPFGVPDGEIPAIFSFDPKEVVQSKIQKNVESSKMDSPFIQLDLLSDEQARFLADDDAFFFEWVQSLN